MYLVPFVPVENTIFLDSITNLLLIVRKRQLEKRYLAARQNRYLELKQNPETDMSFCGRMFFMSR